MPTENDLDAGSASNASEPTAPRRSRAEGEFRPDRFDAVPRTPDRIGAHRAENPRVGGWRAFLLACAAVVVIVGVAIAVSLLSDHRWSTAEPVASASSDVAPAIDTSYSVLVLNGSGVAGAAEKAAAGVVARGWQQSQVTTGNAAASHDPTTVYYASPDARAAALGLAEIVGAATVSENASYPFAGVSQTQLTVVLGADSPAPSSSPSR